MACFVLIVYNYCKDCFSMCRCKFWSNFVLNQQIKYRRLDIFLDEMFSLFLIVVLRTLPLGQKESYTYNNAGNLIKKQSTAETIEYVLL